MFKFFTKEIIIPFEVPEYIILNVDNFNLWFNSPKDAGIYAHPGIFLRLDKLSIGYIIEYIENCYGIVSKEASVKYDLYKFHDEIRADWRKRLNKIDMPERWFVYSCGQSPLHLLWYVTLVNLDDLSKHSSVEEMDSFEIALSEAIKGCN